MPATTIYDDIKAALEGSPRKGYIAELHLQVIKHAHMLENVSGKEFCEAVGLQPSFATEFLKMKKIAPRLRAAGLNPVKI